MTLPPIASRDAPLRPGAQGLARVAVRDATAADPAPRLLVTFARPLRLPEQAYLLSPRSYALTGGQRLFPRVVAAAQSGPAQVTLLLDAEGDFSRYTLTVSGPDIDPLHASRELRFRLACDDPYDPRAPAGPPAAAAEPAVAIDYLAKDYASFRQALLDFVAARMPTWVERSEADIGMMLLELFAAAADQLSYMQDRVANEAFLSSATQRRSVAGHLALLGYTLDEGAAAVTWLHFAVNSVFTLPASPGLQVSTSPRRSDEPPVIFETMGAATLRPEHGRLGLYGWGDPRATMPATALSAALYDPADPGRAFDQLAPGDYLLLEDATTGRQDLVRLAERPEVLPAHPVRARPDGPLTVVRWSAATPLSGDYCLATTTARGNMVPATHGETVVAEVLRELSAEERAAVAAAAALRPGWRTPRQRLRLARGPLAFLDPATLALAAPPGAAPPAGGPSAPAISVSVEGFERPWQPRPSLLDSRPDEPVFRLEIDETGDATVVFGDDAFGRRPDEAARVTATYRVGGGAAGNVAAGTLVEPRPRPNESFAWLDAVTNPLPARGGRDPETVDHARRFGPASFQAPLVAVGPADYQALAQAFRDAQARAPLQRASAAFRWTGSWLTATLAADPRGTAELDAGLRAELLAFLEGRRLAGYDLAVIGARYVPVELGVAFCPAPGFRPADVAAGLRQALGGGLLPDGRRAFFHPDNFSFGDGLYVSRLYAAIMAVPGVESARITRLARLRADEPAEETAANLRQGALRVGADEIVRLDDDRNFPEHGSLAVRQVSAQDAIFRRAALARLPLTLRRLLSERE